MKGTPWLFTLLFTCKIALGQSEEPPPIGNFALPSSQQPGSFISMGQNILEKHQVQFNLMADDYVGNGQYFADLLPNLLYGFSDRFSMQFNLPIALRYYQSPNHSSGLEDSSLQFEYAYFNKANKRYTQQGTVLASINFPTGSAKKNPSTGLGAISYLIGTTFCQLYANWYGFLSPGAILTTSQHRTTYGNKYLYQFGLGKNIAAKSKKWIFASLLELDGQYSKKDIINGIVNVNSGGNVLYLTPSLWFSTPKWIFQCGAGAVVSEHLFGIQNRNHYLLAANVSKLI